MKHTNCLTAFLFCMIICLHVNAQKEPDTDSTGLPGDNFSLQGALQMFRKAASIEEFEKFLNTENNHVNNLDLDENGETDYVRVIDKGDKDVHAFVLQVPVSENENQDIAVIELEKTGDSVAILQIIGDEDIYGEEVIVEPDDEEDTSYILLNDIKISGPHTDDLNTIPVVVNVWPWSAVRFVYGPVYRPWVSPWRWRHYPGWWKPWHPLAWHVWHPFHYAYHRSFIVVNTHRVTRAHAFYQPHRTGSAIVHTRHAAAIGNYRVSHTRTTVTGPRGNSVTRKTTTVRGQNGNVKTRKTTVKRRN